MRQEEVLAFILDTLEEEHLSFAPIASPPHVEASTVRPDTLPAALEEVERRELVAALEKARGSKADAARHLGINRSTLY